MSCATGWLLATAVFVVLVKVLGGLGRLDTYESVFSTWAIAHGQFTCAFPVGYRVIAPVYPLVSGAVTVLDHAGSAVSFPPRSALGPQCDRAFLAINSWSLKSNALNSTLDVGYLGWLVLMGGVVSLLRACGRGRCGWEPATVLVVALLPPVWFCIQNTFHPQDLFAMGFALAAMACARRGAWAAAGVCIALAVLSQQFAVLVAVPLLVLAPGLRRLTYASAAIGAAVLIALPLALVNARGVARAVVFGTGATGGIGGTILSESNLHGVPLDLLSRVAPIALSFMIAWWALRRLGAAAAVQPVALVSLIGVCVGLRLVFEQQLFGYYYLALSVSLVALDVVRGRVRSTVVGWLATVSMVYILGSTQLDLLRPPWLTLARGLIPLSVIALAAALLARDIRRGGPPWKLALWIAMIVAAVVSWTTVDEFNVPPTWVWQVALVPLGLALAAGPLLAEVRNHERTTGTGPLPASDGTGSPRLPASAHGEADVSGATLRTQQGLP